MTDYDPHKVHSTKDPVAIADLAKNLNDRLHFEIHFDNKTEIVHLPTYRWHMWDNPEEFGEHEAGRVILDKITIKMPPGSHSIHGGTTVRLATLFMTVDIDGAWNQYILIGASGNVISTGRLEESIGT